MVQGPNLGTPVKVAPPLVRDLMVATAILFFAGCAQTVVQPLSRSRESKLPVPARVLISNFSIDHSVVSEYQGIMRQQPANSDPIARQSEIARNVTKIFTAELVHDLRRMGFKADMIAKSTVAEDNDLIIEGQFLSVDEGSPMRRLVIGFGSGASKIKTRIQVYRGKTRQKLVEFVTLADSGKLPGVVATLPAGAVAPAGLSVSMTAASAVANGMNVAPSQMTAMAASSAKEAVRFLSEFFAEQGWIEANRAKKAQVVH